MVHVIKTQPIMRFFSLVLRTQNELFVIYIFWGLFGGREKGNNRAKKVH